MDISPVMISLKDGKGCVNSAYVVRTTKIEGDTDDDGCRRIRLHVDVGGVIEQFDAEATEGNFYDWYGQVIPALPGFSVVIVNFRGMTEEDYPTADIAITLPVIAWRLTHCNPTPITTATDFNHFRECQDDDIFWAVVHPGGAVVDGMAGPTSLEAWLMITYKDWLAKKRRAAA